MYNLFFFCKETKLKRKLWLQTVFHTKGREGENGKVLKKWVSVFFPPCNYTLHRCKRSLSLFCRIWRLKFPLKSLWCCEKCLMIGVDRYHQEWSTTHCEALASVTLILSQAHTRYKGGRPPTLSATRPPRVKPTEFAFKAVVGVHCLQSCNLLTRTLSLFTIHVMNVRVKQLTWAMIHSHSTARTVDAGHRFTQGDVWLSVSQPQ